MYSKERFFLARKTYVKTDGQENINNFTLKFLLFLTCKKYRFYMATQTNVNSNLVFSKSCLQVDNYIVNSKVLFYRATQTNIIQISFSRSFDLIIVSSSSLNTFIF